MADVELRFHKDMLVLSAPIDETLTRQGVDAARDRQYLNLMEPDSLRDALRLEVLAGAHCLVTTTEDITQARLAHVRMDADAQRLAHAALAVAADLKPQHILAEIGPCGLPIDGSSKASLNENRNQYANAARAFDGCGFDAFFLNGFTSLVDLKCSLMGLAQVTDKPVFSSVVLGETQGPAAGSVRAAAAAQPTPFEEVASKLPFGGYAPLDEPASPFARRMGAAPLDPSLWPEALDIMVDLGAAVVGFETAEPADRALEYARTAAAQATLPVLAQLCVTEASAHAPDAKLVPVADQRAYTPEVVEVTAARLRDAGVQFLRATGSATPAFTGALAAAVSGLDVRRH